MSGLRRSADVSRVLVLLQIGSASLPVALFHFERLVAQRAAAGLTAQNPRCSVMGLFRWLRLGGADAAAADAAGYRPLGDDGRWCPEEGANPISRLLFSYTDSLMRKGKQKTLEPSDLWDMSKVISSPFGPAKAPPTRWTADRAPHRPHV